MIRRTLFFLLFCSTHPVIGAFTRPARWKLDVIEQIYADPCCYRTGASPTSHGPCSNTMQNVVLPAQLKNGHGAGLSIAYYDLADGSILGGAGWTNWDAVVLPVGACMSGQVDGVDDAYITTCRFTITDHDRDIAASHLGECAIGHAQLCVADGCYTPSTPRPWLRLDESTSAILAIISLILALPPFGLYRQYRERRTRRQVRNEDEQAQPLVRVGGGVVDVDLSQDVSASERGHTGI